MGCFSPEQPQNVNYADLLRQTLTTQVGLQPMLTAANQQFSPLQSGLSLQNLNYLLFGSPEQSYDVQTYTPAAYQSGNRQFYGRTPKDFTGQVIAPPLGQAGGNGGGGGGGVGDFLGSPMGGVLTGGLSSVLGGLFGGGSNRQKIAPEHYGSETHTLGAQRGLIDLLNQANTATRTAGVNDIANLGPEATAALLAANPQAGDLLRTLTQQAQTGLDAGAKLGVTPQEEELYARYAQQASRARYSETGLSGSPVAAADEALKQFALGENLQGQRQQFAGNVLGLNQSYLQNPMLALLTGQGGAAAEGNAQSLLPGQLFNPESAQAGSIASANQQLAALFADPSTLSKINQGVGTVGNIFGAFGKIAGGIAGI